MLQHPASGKIVYTSFDIANHLGPKRLPPSPDSTRTGLNCESLNKDVAFPAPLTPHRGKIHEAYARFNTHADATFSVHPRDTRRSVTSHQPGHGRSRQGPLRQFAHLIS